MKRKLQFMVLMLLGIVLSINQVWGATYTKVLSEPSDWSGTYILGYENGSTVLICQAGEDAASNYVSASISNNVITGDYSDYEIEVGTYSTGYYIKALGGSNSGNFLEGKGSNSNGTSFATTKSKVTTFSFSSGIVTITNNTNIFVYNSASGNLRWRFFKSGTASGNGYYKPCLYKLGSSKTCV